MGEIMTDRDEAEQPKKAADEIIKLDENKVEIVDDEPEQYSMDDDIPELIKTYKNQKLGQFTQLFGLHPLVGFGLFAVDWMLFSADVVSGGFALPITVTAGGLFGIASIFIQRYGFKEDWGLAVGKGLLLGVLTAIPSPLPSIVPFLGGGLGVINMMLESGKKEDG